MEVTKQTLIEAQLKVVADYQKAHDSAPHDLKRKCSEILVIQKRILRNLGHREPVEKKAKPYSKKGFFKKASNKVGKLEVDKDSKAIKNNAKKGMFTPNDVLETESKQIRNKAKKKDLFKAEEVVSDKKEKVNPRRLNQEQIGNIKKLALDGYNPVQISDELMIVIEKVNGVLSKMKKNKGGNLLASSNKSKGNSIERDIKG